MDVMQTSRVNEKRRRAEEKNEWERVCTVFVIDNQKIEKAVNLVKAQEMKHTSGGVCFKTLVNVFKGERLAGKPVRDYSKAAQSLILDHQWPMAKCKSHLAMKLRQWTDAENAKRAAEYRDRKKTGNPVVLTCPTQSTVQVCFVMLRIPTHPMLFPRLPMHWINCLNCASVKKHGVQSC